MRMIASRRFRFPDTPEDLRKAFYFNLWEKRHWPLDALRDGVVLYLYESPTQRFVWKVRAANVGSTEYDSLAEAYSWLTENYGEFDEGQPYLDAPAKAGHCLAFRCDPLVPLNRKKPRGLRLPMLGWVRDEDFISACGLD